MTGIKKPLNLVDLRPRLISALVMVVLAVAANVLGGRVFDLFWLSAACAIYWEWLGLTLGLRPRLLLLAGVAVLAVVAVLNTQGLVWLALLVLTVALPVSAVLSPSGRRFWAMGGLTYAAGLIFSTYNLRLSFPLGPIAIFWLFAVVWGTDIFAYFGGRLLGGPKLWPRVSPSKTWSGFICGISAGALAGLAIAPDTGAPLLIFSLGLCGGAVAQGGDLFESSLKRRFGAKDSSRLIPGHGGVMDRLDGFITASFFAFLIGALRSGLFAPANGLFYW